MRLVVGYVRVSTSKEEQDSSVEGQTWQMEQAGCDRIIVDRASASSGVRRRGWEELRLLVAKGQVEKVLVVDLSRLARDGSDQEFLEECHLVGTTVYDLNGVAYENQSISGLLTTGVLSVVNKVQSRIISVKVRDGVKRRREAGYAARSSVPFGYAVEGGLVVPCPDHWAAARELLEMLIKSEINIYGTIRQLPKEFPWQPSECGLMRWLRNPILRGGIGRGISNDGSQVYDFVEWGKCPHLITPDEWRLILNIFARRPKARSYGNTGKPHLLSGLLRCEKCGRKLHWRTRRNKAGNHVGARYACMQPFCEWRGKGLAEVLVRRRVIEALVSKAAAKMAKLAADGSQPPEVECPELITYREQLAQLQLLEDQGVTGLGVSITRLRDQIVTMLPFPGDAIPAAYEGLFQDPETLLAGSDELLRPVFLHFVLEIIYQGAPDQFEIKLR